MTGSLPREPKPNSIVTGASRGIGRAIAVELAKTHNVIGTYRAAATPPNRYAMRPGARFSSATWRAARTARR